jgi:tRNA threonylcarbamoyladenosine biosynthesis protein TsaE
MGARVIEFVRHSTEEGYTRALAAGLASVLAPGDVIALEGELGAGKTTFVRGLAEGLGVDQAMVSSPTFVFINQYPATKGALAGGHLTHVDAYRLISEEDLEPLGWDRLFDEAGRAAGLSAAVIEWPKRIEPALPRDCARVSITSEGSSHRRIEVSLPESWAGRARLEWLCEREPITCRVTGRWVSPTAPTYPFIDEKARDADMYQWFTGGYKTSRELRQGEGEA